MLRVSAPNRAPPEIARARIPDRAGTCQSKSKKGGLSPPGQLRSRWPAGIAVVVMSPSGTELRRRTLLVLLDWFAGRVVFDVDPTAVPVITTDRQ
jgi:hypothetical protein